MSISFGNRGFEVIPSMMVAGRNMKSGVTSQYVNPESEGVLTFVCDSCSLHIKHEASDRFHCMDCPDTGLNYH